MKTLNLCFTFFLLSQFCFSQGFELTYGENDEWPNLIFESPDEEFYFVISQPLENTTSNPLNISKIDKEGNIIFKQDYPFTIWDPVWNSFNKGNLIVESSGFWLAVAEWNPNNTSDIAILNFDFNGNLIFENKYTIPNGETPNNAILLDDKSVIFSSLEFSNEMHRLTRISKEGNVIWTKPEIFKGANFLQKFVKTKNNEFLISSTLWDENTFYKFDYDGNLIWKTPHIPHFGSENFIIPFPNQDRYLVYGEDSTLSFTGSRLACINDLGEILWEKDFKEHLGKIEENAVIMGENNTLYMTGRIYDGNKDQTGLLQLDETGNVLWEKSYYEFDLTNSGQLIRDRDDGFVIAMEGYPGAAQGASSDPYVIKVDKNGNFLWSYHNIKMDYYLHKEVILTSDGGYLVLGQRRETSDDDFKINLLKIDQNGNVYTRQVNGVLVIDENKNCEADPGEKPLEDWVIQLNGRQTFFSNTNLNGAFNLNCNLQNPTIQAIPKNEFWEACPLELQLQFDSTYDTLTVDLSMQILEECPALEVDISTPFLRRCFENTYHVSVRNTGTIKAITPTIYIELDTFFIDPDFSNVNATINGQSVEVLLPDMELGEVITFKFKVTISCDADLGQEHCVSTSAIAENDCDKNDFKIAYEYTETKECQENIGSFDPNDKRAFSAGRLTERFIPADSTIEYQIRFQNTGTDTAFNIVVLDTLSELLDITSLRLGASSHPVKFEVDEIRRLKFSFENINLLDSLNHESESHGFVKFKIKPVEGLLPRDIISNSASIYFDFNDPIITNKLDLEIKGLSSVFESPQHQIKILNLFPQPASDILNIKFINGWHPSDSNLQLEIRNSLGELVLKKVLTKKSIEVSHLPAGNYFYQYSENGEPLQSGAIQIIR